MRWSIVVSLQLVLIGAGLNSTVFAEVFANSETDWSVDGAQGENGWFYGMFNLTNDDDGVYDPSEFEPFENEFGPAGGPVDPFGNHWTGTQWDLTSDAVGPWTQMQPLFGHPNGENSAPNEEMWAVRRWVSDITGPFTIESFLGAQNAGGSGTTVNLFQNGTLLDTMTTNSPAGLTQYVTPTLAIGDILDFALTPQGTGGVDDRGDGSDGSNYRMIVSDDPPPEPPVPAYADSADDWSTTGTQGERNWFNGYYNLTADDDGVYQTEDFIPFTNDAGPGGGPVEPDGNHWTGTAYDLQPGAPGPWTTIAQNNTHPNGTNSEPGDEHWTIRRYVADDLTTTTPIELNWQTAKQNTGGGNGVTGVLFVNGEQVDTVTIAGTDGTGVSRNFYINAEPGDIIELALTPNGADGSDGTTNRLTLRTDLPDGPLYNPGATVADSQAEFSQVQGQDGWFYGYYDQRDDAENGDGIYDPEEFIPFLNDGSDFVWDDATFDSWQEGENHWDGGKWDLLNNGVAPTNGPWTEMTEAGGHPAANAQGDLAVHWAVRRWVSEDEGDFTISGLLNNTSANGDGTVGRILMDGEEIWSAVSDGTIEEVDVPVTLLVGSVLDFVIDPDGAGSYDPADPTTIDLVNDGSDGTVFSFTIGSKILFVPAGGLVGDFNGNGVLDTEDIDDLTRQSAGMTNPPTYDLNDDSLVNSADVTVWIRDLFDSWVGDANLDGEFNTADLVTVLASGTYEVDVDSAWSLGDFNGDGRTNTGDLVLALADGGYEQGVRPATAAVPEPSSVVLLLSAIAMLAYRRRG